jgi:hypothetical protein
MADGRIYICQQWALHYDRVASQNELLITHYSSIQKENDQHISNKTT